MQRANQRHGRKPVSDAQLLVGGRRSSWPDSPILDAVVYHQDPGRILAGGRAKPASHPLTVTLSATATVGGGPPSPEALLHHQ